MTNLDELQIPTAFDAEQALLATLIFENQLLDTARAYLQHDDFFHDGHKLIYKAMVKVFDDEGEFNPVTVAAYLRHEGELERVGGHSYISEFYSGHVRFTQPESLMPYLRLVKEASIHRRIIHLSGLLQSQAQDRAPVLEMIVGAERQLEDLRNQATIRREDSIADVVDRVLSQLEQIEVEQAPHGLRTGFCDLDRAIQGYEPGMLYVVAAGSNEGKTTFALQSIWRATRDRRNGQPVIGVVSLEMPKEKIVKRFIQLASGVPSDRMDTGKMTEDDKRAVSEAGKEIAKIRIKVADPDKAVTDEVRGHVQDLRQTFGRADLVIVDYVQMLKLDDPGFQKLNRANQLDEVIYDLKRMAMTHNCSMIVLSQLTGEATKSRDRSLNDLRDSRGITQAADYILMLTPQATERERVNMQFVPYELGIVKNRYGKKPRIPLLFSTDLGTFGEPV